MNEMLTAAIGVGLFYLLLNPGRVRESSMMLGACIVYGASILVTLPAPFSAEAAKTAVVLNVLTTVATLVLIYLAINPFARSSSASPPAEDERGMGEETNV